jgi:hypothetical protein
MSARPMRLDIYRTTAHYVDPYDEHVTTVRFWRWRIRASNGRILADSGEAYGRLRDCAHGAGLVTGMYVPAKPGDFIRTTTLGTWRITVESPGP